MVHLPPDIIKRIVSYYDGPATNLLTVSRDFQDVIEEHLWPHICVNESTIRRFRGACHGNRISLIRSITFRLRFARLHRDAHRIDRPRYKCRLSMKQAHADNELFTRQISLLFAVLRTLEYRGAETGHPMGKVALEIASMAHGEDEEEEVTPSHRRYHSWRLCLLNRRSLPSLRSISSLEFSRELSDDAEIELHPVDLRVLIDLASKLPGLKSLKSLYLHERFSESYLCRPKAAASRDPWIGPMRDSRIEFARAVGEALAKSAAQRMPDLECLELHFWKHPARCLSIEETAPVADMLGPLLYDPLSTAIRLISVKLVHLDLRVIADSTLFWPHKSERGAVPAWPHLKTLAVEFHPATPRGTWYFCGRMEEGRAGEKGYAITQLDYPPTGVGGKYWEYVPDNPVKERSETESESDIYRTNPIDEVMEPLLEAFGRALGCMPALQNAELHARIYRQSDEGLHMENGGEGEECQMENGEREGFHRALSPYKWGVQLSRNGFKQHLAWRTDYWRPSDNVVDVFHTVACHGDKGLLEDWLGVLPL